MRPTEEQIKRFWEWCGARCINCNHLISSTIKQDMCCCHSYELDLDLNNLFQYAVPKWIDTFPHSGGSQVAYRIETPLFITLTKYGNSKEATDLDYEFALALFWAIWKVIGKGD